MRGLLVSSLAVGALAVARTAPKAAAALVQHGDASLDDDSEIDEHHVRALASVMAGEHDESTVSAEGWDNVMKMAKKAAGELAAFGAMYVAGPRVEPLFAKVLSMPMKKHPVTHKNVHDDPTVKGHRCKILYTNKSGEEVRDADEMFRPVDSHNVTLEKPGTHATYVNPRGHLGCLVSTKFSVESKDSAARKIFSRAKNVRTGAGGKLGAGIAAQLPVCMSGLLRYTILVDNASYVDFIKATRKTIYHHNNGNGNWDTMQMKNYWARGNENLGVTDVIGVPMAFQSLIRYPVLGRLLPLFTEKSTNGPVTTTPGAATQCKGMLVKGRSDMFYFRVELQYHVPEYLNLKLGPMYHDDHVAHDPTYTKQERVAACKLNMMRLERYWNTTGPPKNANNSYHEGGLYKLVEHPEHCEWGKGMFRPGAKGETEEAAFELAA